MKIKKSIGLVLIITMLMAVFMPTIVNADATEYAVWVNGEQFTSEKETINCGTGTATFDGNNTLTLTNAQISNTYEYQPWYEAMIYSAIPNLIIKVEGTNTISSSNTYADGIDAAGGCNITITGGGTLNINNAYYGTYIGSWDVPGGNLTVNGNTKVNVTSSAAAGIWVNKDINFTNCSINISRSNTSYNGLVSNINGTITITNSNVSISNPQSAIHMGNSDNSSHNLVLNSGTLTVNSSNAYGIYIYPQQDDGTINGKITINGGTLNVTSNSGGTNLSSSDIVIDENLGYSEGTSLAASGNVVIEKIETPIPTATKINTVNATITAPAVGTKIAETTEPTVTVANDANYTVGFTIYVNNYPSKDASYDDGSIFGTTVEDGKYYYLEVYLAPKDGYEFDTSDNVTLNVNGGTDYELGYCSDNQFAFFTKVKATATSSEETTYTVLEGADQSVAKGEELTFRFSIEYAKFLESGKVYMDGELVDSSNYTTKEGSTIVTFNQDYTNTLKVGKHTVKVAVADGEASADFTITKASSNPKTGDNIMLFVGLFIVATLGSVVIIRKIRK